MLKLRNYTLMVVAVAAALLAAKPATGQTYFWQGINGTSSIPTYWSDAANWTAAPTFGVDATLVFNGSPLQVNSGYFMQPNLPAATANSLQFNIESSPFSATTTNGIVLTAASGLTDLLTLEASSTAVAPSIVQNGYGTVLINQNGSFGSLGISATAPLNIGGTGTGLVRITAPITGGGATGGININASPAALRPFFSGASLLLSGANTFTGDVTLTNGNLALSTNVTSPITPGSSACPLGAITNQLIINPGNNSLRFVSNGGNSVLPAFTAQIVVRNPVVLNSTMNFVALDTWPGAFTGVISGSSGITMRNYLSNAPGSQFLPLLALQNAHTFTGPLIVRPFIGGAGSGANGTVAINSNVGGTHGSLATTDIRLYPSASLSIDNTTANVANRLNPATVIQSYRANIGLTAIAGTPAVDGAASLIAAGQTVMTMIPTATSGATFTIGSLTRVQNGVLEFRGTGIGGTIGANNVGNIVITNNPGGQTAGGTTPGTQNLAVLPYGFSSSTSTFNTTTPIFDLVRWDAASGKITPLVRATEYAGAAALAAPTTAGLNYRIAGAAAGGATLTAAGTSVNGLVIDSDNATLPPIGVSIGGSGALNVSGPILFAFTGSPSFTSTFLPSQIAVGSLNFGANPGYIHTADRTISAFVTITSPISGSGGVVKSGNDGLILANANNFTGGLTVNAGHVDFDNDANLGAAGGGITLNSGFGDGLLYANNPLYGTPVGSNTTISRPLTLGPAGGTFNNTTRNSLFTYAGQITGIGNLGIAGATGGAISLTNTANNFNGEVVVGGTLIVPNDAVLGGIANRITFNMNSTFQIAPGYSSTNRDFLVGGLLGTSTFHTNGNDFTLNGTLGTLPFSPTAGGTSSGMSFTKIGAGMLTMTANNSFEGIVTVGEASTIAPRASSPAGSAFGGSLRLTGPNGALSSAQSYTVNAGSALIVDNAAAANTNRLSLSFINLNGGDLSITGNAGTSINEQVGMIAPLGGTSIITLTQPDSGGVGRSTVVSSPLLSTYFIQFGTVNLTPQTPVGGNLFVRGTNLGAASGDRTALYFATDPTTVNGLVAGVVTASSATSAPTDFAKTVLVGTQYSLVPLAPGDYGTVLGAGPGVTVDQTGSVPVPLTGPVSMNALRLGTGGGLDLGGQTLTLGAAVSNLQTGMILTVGGPNAGIVNGALDFGVQPARFITVSDLTLGTAANPITLNGSTTTGATVIKSGPGRLTIYGTPATNVGHLGTTVGEGTLVLGNATPLRNTTSFLVPNALTGSITVAPGATLDINNQSLPISNLFASGTVALGDGTIYMGANSNFSGTLTGSISSKIVVGYPQALAPGNTFAGGQQTQLYGDNSGFQGQFIILNGLLRAFSTSAFGSGTSPIIMGDTTGGNAADLRLGDTIGGLSRDVIVQGGGTGLASINSLGGAVHTLSGSITMNKNVIFSGGSGNGVQIITGQISGPGQLQLAPGLNSGNGNAGNYIIANGANTYTGGTLINAGFTASTQAILGVVGVGADTAFSTGPLAFGSFAGLMKAESGARTVANQIFLRQTNALSGGATLANINFGSTGLNDLTLTGPITPQASTGVIGMTLTLNSISQANTTLAGTISNGFFPSLGIIKNGPAQVVLSGNNSHSGITNVNAGTLKIGHANALGNLGRVSTLNNNGGTTVAAGSVIDLNGQQGVTEVLTLNGGALVNTSSTRAVVTGGAVSSLTLTGAGTPVATAPTITITGDGTGATAVATLALTNASFNITAGGSGFQQLTTFQPPVVTITGGGGTGAAATPTYGLTSASYTINGIGGSLYVTPPTVTFPAQNGGIAATGHVTLDAPYDGVNGGHVNGIIIDTPGTLYTSVPTVSVNNTGTGGSGLFLNNINGQFTVTGLALTNPGTGYTGVATVTIAPNTTYGVGAAGNSNTSNYGVGIQMTNNGTGYTSTPSVGITGSTATATANLAAIALTANSLAGGSGDLQIDSVINGTGFGLTKIGGGTLILNGANTFTGAVVINQGRLSIASIANGGVASPLGQSTSAAANLTFLDGATLEFTGANGSSDRGMTFNGGSAGLAVAEAAGTLSLSGAFVGNGGLTAIGPGTLALSGGSTFTGVVNVVGGTLSVATLPNGGAAGPLGQSSAAAANVVLSGGTLRYTGASSSSDRGFTFGPSGGTIAVGSAAANFSIGGSLVGGGSLTKTGPGTLTLAGLGSYTGSTTVTDGTLAVAAESAFGNGNVSAGPLGTVVITASTTLTKTYAMTGGTLAAASGATATFSGGTFTGGHLAGPGTFATSATPSLFASVTLLPSAVLNVNAPTGTFVNVVNGGAVNVAGGLGSPATFNGFQIQSSGSLTIGVNSTVQVANFQSNGVLTLAPSGVAGNVTQLVNIGASPLQFGGGSRTFIGNPATVAANTAGINLNFKDAIVAGGLLVNNGGNGPTSGVYNGTTIVDFGGRAKGVGYYEDIITQNGGVFSPGNSPGTTPLGTMRLQPGGILNIDVDAAGSPGVGGVGASPGWSLVQAVTNLRIYSTAAAPHTVSLTSLLVGTNNPAPVFNFDSSLPYSWEIIRMQLGANLYDVASGGTPIAPASFVYDPASVNVQTSGTFLNSLNGGTFSSAFQPNGTGTYSVYITFSPIPEPGLMLGLGGLAAFGLLRRRRGN